MKISTDGTIWPPVHLPHHRHRSIWREKKLVFAKSVSLFFAFFRLRHWPCFFFFVCCICLLFLLLMRVVQNRLRQWSWLQQQQIPPVQGNPEKAYKEEEDQKMIFVIYFLFCIREEFRRKNPYVLWSFTILGAGGAARVVKQPYCFFEKSIFSESM